MATSSRSTGADRPTGADCPTAAWQYAGTLDHVWEGEMCAAKLGAVDVLLCNVDGQLVAYQDRCPHLANPLSAGALRDNVITCAAHEWSFDARTGRGVNPETYCLRSYPVRIDGERIFVDVGSSS